jgi:hypothetical protein
VTDETVSGENVSGAAVPAADLRVSDRDRDETVTRLQIAFAEGRLDDEEFDLRVRNALAARTRGQLARMAADLPTESSHPAALAQPTGLAPAKLRKPGRLSLAYKTALRRGGRWRVPGKFTAVSYKGGGTVIDLRAAELTSAATTIRAIAYKCRIQVLVPPGMHVESSGIGVTNTDESALDAAPPAAPVVHVRGIAYKGLVEIRTTPEGTSPGPRHRPEAGH